MAKKQEDLSTLNLTVVALVALVAIVGVTAIVLNGGSSATPDFEEQYAEENVLGAAGGMDCDYVLADSRKKAKNQVFTQYVYELCGVDF